MATKDKDKGSLARLIARAKEAQVTPEPDAESAPSQPEAEPVPASVKSPRSKAEAPARRSRGPKRSRPPAVPEPAADRRLGRRGNPDYRQANAYIPKSLHLRIKRGLLEEGDREFSSLVEELLEKWAAEKGV